MIGNPFSLDGKRILITGASSGIGRTMSRIFSELGASLFLVGRDEAELQGTFSITKNKDWHKGLVVRKVLPMHHPI